MQLNVTFRHMETSPAIKDYLAEKLQKIEKYFDDPMRGQVVLSLERHRHQVDILITLHNGITLKGKEVTEDMYAAIDLVIDKIDRQVKKYKDKIRSHRPESEPEILAVDEVVTIVPEVVEEIESPIVETEPKIVKKSKCYAKPLNPEQAVTQMNLLNNEFLVFTNAKTGYVNVVYKRRDETYGLIETRGKDEIEL